MSRAALMNAGAKSLSEWLDYVGTVHPVGIDLGLSRVGRVAERMGFEAPAHRPAPHAVIVAGTNGKGSTCIALEALLRAAGFSVGTTLSPHLHVFNERVRVNGGMLDDAALCGAFARVEGARGDTPLTYFEFAALVALDCFRRARVDVAILEVGLGGRLDAFNMVHADVAVITSIGLDHQAYLGDDVETIGREKAGVMRPGQRVVLGADISASVEECARRLDCPGVRLGVDFHVHRHGVTWDFLGTCRRVTGLVLGGLAPSNCALALEAADQLMNLMGHERGLPGGGVHEEGARRALAGATLPGRMEIWRIGTDGRLLVIDVAHNPAGARFLGELLAERFPDKRFVALVGMLDDKDAAGVAAALDAQVRQWICVPTRGARGQSGEALAERIASRAAGACVAERDVVPGVERAFSSSQPGDGMLAFGSFDLVERMHEALLTGAVAGLPVTGEAFMEFRQ